jgi:hypothetical protein
MDVFMELRSSLEQELERTGYRSPDGPPFAEPEMPRRLRELTTDQTVDLLDDFQSFYNYLSDEITNVLTFEGAIKARVDLQYATVKMEVLQDKSLTNEASRSAAIETDPRYLSAMRDYLFFKQSHAQLEERRRKISKSLERLYRELIYRDQQANQRPQPLGHHPNRAPMPAPFRGKKEKSSEVRTVRYEDGVSGKPDDPAPERQQDVHQDQERPGPVQGNESILSAGISRALAAVAAQLSDSGPEPTAPARSRAVSSRALQQRFSEEYAEPVPQEGRVKPGKGRRRPDFEDGGY